jgi:hypothetical protein
MKKVTQQFFRSSFRESFGGIWVLSGKHTKSYGKSPSLIGKYKLFLWAIFNSKLFVYQWVYTTMIHVIKQQFITVTYYPRTMGCKSIL